MILKSAFQITRRSFGMILWLYGINLVVSLLILFPAYATLKTEAGHSLEFVKLLDGFDATVFTDFMHTSGKAVGPLLSVGRWLGLLYGVLSVFFTGGILFQLSSVIGTGAKAPSFRLSSFLQSCGPYFWRFLRVSALTTGLVIGLAVIGILIAVVIVLAGEDSLNEQQMLVAIAAGFLLVGLPATVLLCAGDYARVLLFRHDGQRAIHALKEALRFVLRNGKTAYGLYGLLMGAGAILFGLYFVIEAPIQASGWLLIGLLFTLQQLLIFARVWLKVGILATALTVVANREAELPAVMGEGSSTNPG